MIPPASDGAPATVNAATLEVEQALLGALLIDSEAWPKVAPIVGASDFHLVAHQRVFGAIAEFATKGQVVDPVLVNQQLGDAVPATLVPGLSRSIGITGNVEHYARKVVELHQERAGGPVGLKTSRISMAEVLAPHVEKMLLGSTCPLGKVTLVFGPTGVGKSALLAQVVFGLAAGERELWGLPLIEGGGPVLVYTAEDSLDDWRLKAAALHRGGEIDLQRALARLHIVDKTEGTARFSEVVTTRSDTSDGQVTRHRSEPTEEREHLIAAARRVGAVAILVETASRLVDEEDNASFSALQSALGHIARQTGAAVLLTHHATKAASQTNDSSPEAARGGGALVANARNVIALFPAEPEQTKPFRDRFAAADLFALVHVKSTSSTRRQAPLVLARCDGSFGAVFRRPDEAPASPEQARAAAARLEAEQRQELELIGRLYDVVAKYLPTRPQISASWLRENARDELGIAKHGVEKLVAAAEQRGVLKVRNRNSRGATYCLGRDPRLPISEQGTPRACSGESTGGTP